MKESTKDELNEFINTIMLDSLKESFNNNSVTLQTIHQAKGLEYKIVFLVGISENILPKKNKELSQTEEERRIFYVGITRAMNYLHILHTKTRVVNGVKVNYLPSTFIKEIM